MAEATSPTTGRRYGVARVCQIWDQPRSSFYAARQPQAGAVAPASASARYGRPGQSIELYGGDSAIEHHEVSALEVVESRLLLPLENGS